MPRVSVLMAVHNGMPCLLEAVDSILAQTFRDFEFVIVDDGSTDETAAVLNDYEQREPRLRVLRNDKKMSLPVSLNRGLSQCKARWVARMDADDIALPDRLEKQISFLTKHPEIGLIGSGSINIDAQGKEIGLTRHPCDDRTIRFMLPFWCCFVHPSVIFQRELVEQVDGYDASMWTGQDYDLWARLLSVTKAANLPDQLIYYRIHGRSISQSTERKASHEQIIAKVYRLLMSRYLGTQLNDKESLALRSLVMADRVLDDDAVETALPLLERYWNNCRLNEKADLASRFRGMMVNGLLAQAYYLKGQDSRVRHRLLLKALMIGPGVCVSKKGARACLSLLLPNLVWQMFVRFKKG